MKAFFSLFFCLFCIFTAQHANGQKAEVFKWLIGTWKLKTGNGQIVESWKMLNDSTFQGKSILIKNGQDSVLQESLEFSLRKGSWFYISTVVGQNNNQPVAFKMTYQRGPEFICTNPEHDFPQRIAYLRLSNTQLLASIEGSRNGRFSKQNFNFTQE